MTWRSKQPRYVQITPAGLREMEILLSKPLFEGLPVGPTLGNAMLVELYQRRGDWRTLTRLKTHVRHVLRLWHPQVSHGKPASVADDRILVTWMSQTDRVRQLVLPVISALGPHRCATLVRDRTMLTAVPLGCQTAHWGQLLRYNAVAWRTAFRRVWPEWQRRVNEIVGRFELPHATRARLGFLALVHSQYLFACQAFFRSNRPKAVLVEFDRDAFWACLTLAAAQAGVPTWSLMHGVVNEDAVGYVPCLADHVFCWGERDRDKLLAAGEPRGRFIVAGCPRVTRELEFSPAAARRALGLGPTERVVMLATAPIRPQEAEAFVREFAVATRNLAGVRAAVRLHPSETPRMYRSVAEEFPGLVWWSGSVQPLDVALSASDVVVVRNSGLGGDALVKRRPVVVLDSRESPRDFAADLVSEAGCARARDASELTATLRTLFDDANEVHRSVARAERFVERSYAAFGREAAERIAASVIAGACPSRRVGEDVRCT